MELKSFRLGLHQPGQAVVIHFFEQFSDNRFVGFYRIASRLNAGPHTYLLRFLERGLS
jgi:hypothetical protein